MKLLLRLGSSTALAIEADDAILRQLSEAHIVNCTTDYNGIVTSISPSESPVTMLLLTDSQFKRLAPLVPVAAVPQKIEPEVISG